MEGSFRPFLYLERVTSPLRLHILGASGSGTTTLGHLLARHLNLCHLDTDDFFWEPSEPPYTTKRDPSQRLALLHRAFAGHDRWVLSGSLCGWGDPLIPLFGAVIFLTVPAETRLERTCRRERERYGAELEEGGRMYQKHREFMAWSAGYDDPMPSVGRSRLGQETWLAGLPCPVIRIENTGTRAELLAAAVAGLSSCSVTLPGFPNPASSGA